MSTEVPQPAAKATGLSRHASLVLASVALALIALDIVAGLYATGRQDASFPVDSPRAVFQGYLRAWDTDDTDGAYAMLSERARTRVSEREFRQAHRWSSDESRIRMVREDGAWMIDMPLIGYYPW